MDFSLLVSSYSARVQGRKISQQQMLYEALREAILDGQIKPGARLVPTRVFAEELRVARNSVLWAYERLTDEGFVESGRKGSIVATVGVAVRQASRVPANASNGIVGGTTRVVSAARLADATYPACPAHTEAAHSARTDRPRQIGPVPATNETAFPQQPLPHAERDTARDALAVQHRPAALLSPGIPALDAFPIARWRSAIDRAWRRAGVAELGHTYPHGHPALREAIAAYLRVSRSVRCEAANIIVTDSTHTSLDICARTLLVPQSAMPPSSPSCSASACDPVANRIDSRHAGGAGGAGGEGDGSDGKSTDYTVWIENPGYSGAQAAFRGAGIQIVPMPVDRDGLLASAEDWQRMPPTLVYLTPSHQYPLGSVLSLPRRQALVTQARASGAWVIEDDYDSEFRHDGTPLPALQGLTEAAPVIYLGTFSKTLFPALRIAFMVVPDALAEVIAHTTQAAKRQGRLVDQLALAGFIESGAYTIHLRRMRRLYAQRRAALLTAIDRHLAGCLTVSGGETGMHLTVRLDAPLRDVDVSRATAAAGLDVSPLSEYCYAGTDKSRYNGFVLGYANLPVTEADRCAQLLATVIGRMRHSP